MSAKNRTFYRGPFDGQQAANSCRLMVSGTCASVAKNTRIQKSGVDNESNRSRVSANGTLTCSIDCDDLWSGG